MDLKKYLQTTTVGQIGHRKLLCVAPDATIGSAVEIMQKNEVGCLLIADEDGLRGIFTERDLVKRVLAAKRPMSAAVSEVMTPSPVTVNEQEALQAVLNKMHVGGYRHLPVVGQSGEAVGTISVKRLAGYIADHFASTVYTLPPEPDRYPDSGEGA